MVAVLVGEQSENADAPTPRTIDGLTEDAAQRFHVVCSDDVTRGRFPTRHEAERFAEWGHICMRNHMILDTDHEQPVTPAVSARVRRIVDAHGGFDAFLHWCETSAPQVDALSTFDITDDEWAELHREMNE